MARALKTLEKSLVTKITKIDLKTTFYGNKQVTFKKFDHKNIYSITKINSHELPMNVLTTPNQNQTVSSMSKDIKMKSIGIENTWRASAERPSEYGLKNENTQQ